ncbi:hypothetical protein [Aeromonas sp. AE23HZ002T15]
MSIFFDIIELTAVFFLAAEAIKLENLKVLVEKYLKPLVAKLNPKIELVDDVSHLRFFERNQICIFCLVFYSFGVIIIISIFYLNKISPSVILHDLAPIYWVLLIVGVLFIPFVIGFLPYQLVVWFFEYSIKALTWVQTHTHTGAVGILGFIFFVFQYLGRRVFS